MRNASRTGLKRKLHCCICLFNPVLLAFLFNDEIKWKWKELEKPLIYLQDAGEEVGVFMWPIRSPDERDHFDNLVGEEAWK